VAGNVSVLSNLNKANDTTGSVAKVGSNGTSGNVSVTIVGGGVSKANATISANVAAYVLGASMNVGVLSVKTDANSYANADILVPSTSFGLFNASIIETNANAAGTFLSKVDSTGQRAGETIAANSVDIVTTYYANSFAATGPAGGLNASFVSATSNKATAQTGLSATALLSGSGNVDIAGGANVQVLGHAKAESLGRTYHFTVSGLSIAVNTTSATLNATQRAEVKNTGAMTILGSLTIDSEFIKDGSGYGSAKATTGGAGGGTSISIFSANTNVARSITAAMIYAGITNDSTPPAGSILKAGSVNIDAVSTTESTASALAAFEVAVATIGHLDATALTYSTVEAYIKNATLEADGNVSIDSSSTTTAKATSDSPGGVGVVSSSKGKARTFIGTPVKSNLTSDESDGLDDLTWSLAQTSGAYISAASVTAGGNIGITAYNTGSAESEIKRGTTVGLASINKSLIPTFSEYSTRAQVLSQHRECDRLDLDEGAGLHPVPLGGFGHVHRHRRERQYDVRQELPARGHLGGCQRVRHQGDRGD
jgi:hypothetical protein